ncbi:MAG: hypothetical protein ACYC0F_08795 [Rhodanobacter sp.]
MSIELHIERLVIDEAVLGGERAAGVRAAIERELAQRLMDPGAADSLRRLGVRDALAPATLPAAMRHEQLGTRIATALQQGLGLPVAAHGRSAARHG